jgi:nucleoside-diphosphate-sugar epimerase
MRVLVIGGAGFIGRHLVGRLVAQGHVVHVPTRQYKRGRELMVHPTVTVMQADVRTTTLRPPPPNALSEQERCAILAVCNSPEFASLPPSQIVPSSLSDLIAVFRDNPGTTSR